MASPTFGTKANAGGATAANVTCNVPASTADGDGLLFFLSKDATDAVTDVAGTWNNVVNATANTFHMWIGWKRASSEPASYTFNFASTWRDCVMLRYTGIVGGSENFLDPDTPPAVVEQGSVTSLASNNITTTTTDTTAVAFANNKSIITWAAAPAGWTARQNSAGNELYVIDQAFTTPQTITGPTMSSAGGTPSGPMKAYIVTLQSQAASTPAGYTPGQEGDFRHLVEWRVRVRKVRIGRYPRRLPSGLYVPGEEHFWKQAA